VADVKSCIVVCVLQGQAEQCPSSLNLAFVKWTIIVI